MTRGVGLQWGVVFGFINPTMLTFQDHSHFLAISGTVVAAAAYLSPCFAHKDAWIRYMGSALASEMLYMVLALQFPGVFDYSYLTAVGTIIGLCILLLVAFRLVFNVALVGVLFVLVLPWVTHMAGVLVKWSHAHTSWRVSPVLALTLVLVFMLLLWCVVYLVRAVNFVLIGLFVFVVPLVLFIYLRLDAIEWSSNNAYQVLEAVDSLDGFNTTYVNVTMNTIACDFSLGFHVEGVFNTTTVESCPLAIEDPSQLVFLVGLYLVEVSLVVTTQRTRLCCCCCCCESNRYRQVDEEDEEEPGRGEGQPRRASSVQLVSAG